MVQQRPTALVTGAAKRVGRAIVHRLAHEGYDVALTYLNSHDEAQELVDELRPIARVMALRADLTDTERACDAIYAAVDNNFHRLDVLVNNASIYRPGADLQLLRDCQAVHVHAPLLLAQKFQPMLRQSHGHIINMLDLLAERPWPKYLAYCTSKAAMSNLTLSLALELAPEVTVNGIAPGAVAWPDDYPESERSKYLKRVPLARAGTADDVAEAVMFFARHAPYVTGQILRLDGGRSIT